MNTPPNRSGPAGRGAMPAFGAFPGNRASLLLEKANPGLRRSTPDSEALASDDDETEQTRVTQQTLTSKVAKAPRRTSWLNEMPPPHRRTSNTMSGTYSPSTSHPTTPSTEQVSWISNPSPGISSGAAWNTPGPYSWGSVWSDNRKDPPARLQEVLPSPTTMKEQMKFSADDPAFQQPARAIGESAIPFSIPLQPTPKTYRSQSYSVGQLDTGAVIPPTTGTASPVESQRSRFGIPSSGLQRRSSRQGILHDTGGLEQVKEGDDDEESRQERDLKAEMQARMISKLERENAELRQAAQERDRTAAVSTSFTAPSLRNTIINRSVPEESDLAIDDGEDFQHTGASPLRPGDQSSVFSERQLVHELDNRASENSRKAHWQTSLGFGPVVEPPQSRRHSFADVPTRHGSFSSTGEKFGLPNVLWPGANDAERDDSLKTYESLAQDKAPGNDRESPIPLIPQPTESEMEEKYSRDRYYAAKYFNNHVAARREAEAKVEKAFAANNPYGRYTGVGSNILPSAQSLYIVNFKCNRADVFYIQEGTGLQVNEGDLVIVEADRGTDLGAVQHANVTWEQARYYKEHYAEEHYKLLMMFSMQARNGGPNVVNPNGLQGAPGSAVGGMGPPGHHAPHENPHGDIKPKMIKRHAQPHEIQALQEKEGNEAKAKRVCQQKVQDHGLQMEILDAEFQMDSKKLTFYYFADTYINFNSLVTDLFKIYKTRIWMSAINPASFVTPTASLAPTAYTGPSFGTGRQSPASRRRQHTMPFGQGNQANYEETFDHRRILPQNIRGPQREQYYNGYPSFDTVAPQTPYGLQGYPQAAVDPFTPYIPYQMLNANAPNFAPSQNQDARSRANHQQPNTNWVNKFQGLSLGS